MDILQSSITNETSFLEFIKALKGPLKRRSLHIRILLVEPFSHAARNRSIQRLSTKDLPASIVQCETSLEVCKDLKILRDIRELAAHKDLEPMISVRLYSVQCSYASYCVYDGQSLRAGAMTPFLMDRTYHSDSFDQSIISSDRIR